MSWDFSDVVLRYAPLLCGREVYATGSNSDEPITVPCQWPADYRHLRYYDLRMCAACYRAFSAYPTIQAEYVELRGAA